MKFTYQCLPSTWDATTHVFEADFKPGTAPKRIVCRCGQTAVRDFAADFASQTSNTGDPFRAYHLSTAKDRAAGEQQRRIGGPTDNFERRRLEAVHGRQYVGNDTSGMTQNAQRAIAMEKERKSAQHG